MLLIAVKLFKFCYFLLNILNALLFFLAPVPLMSMLPRLDQGDWNGVQYISPRSSG